MNRIAMRLCAAWAFSAAMLFSTGLLAGEKVGMIDVSVEPLPSKDTAYGSSFGVCHGYIEMRVRLKNLSNDDQVVQLSYPPTQDQWVSEGVVVTRTVPVAGGQEAVVSLFQPQGASPYEMLEISVKGTEHKRIISVSSLRDYRYDNNYPAAVLVSRAVPQEFRDQVHPTSPPPTGGMGTATVALLRSEQPVEQWSTNWLGYTCYDAILLTEQEANAMPPQVQLALRRYLECGGSLVIHGREVPAAFSKGAADDGNGGYLVGFGHAAASHDDGQPGWDAIQKRWAERPPYTYRPEQKPSELHDLLLTETTVPVRGLFVLVLLFGIGIGPANLWLLSRYRRRIWLWWNVPAISLLTCLLVFAYSLASEGVTGRGKTASLTLLDERCHRAATIGYVSYYCPLTPSSGPQFSVETEVTLLENNIDPWRRHSPYGTSTGLRVVDWTAHQHLASGWVNARVPTYFQIRKNEDRRERLLVKKKDDESMTIVNALGADIDRLFWADESGHVFEGRSIPAGAEATLKATAGATLASEGAPRRLRDLFERGGSDWLIEISGCVNNPVPGSAIPGVSLSPGYYVAFLDQSPFVESPLDGVESDHTAAIVYGISKEPNDGR